MADLTKHVMINKWDDDINNAIQEVGGDTYGSEGLPDYADIIKTQLISNTAIDDKVYQNFLYVDEDNQTSPYPWDGEPTTSKNAVQSSVVADSLNQLYRTMASTERFNVLLVEEIPTNEINLSAVYLLKSKCCGDPECDCCSKENTYTGCYFIKTGKKLKRIDIPEFKINLNELFFLTRAEYDSNLSSYLSTIENLLKKKFGQYWNNEDFDLYNTISELRSELNQSITELRQDLISLKSEINSNINTAISDLKTELKLDDANMKSEINSNINTAISDLKTELKLDDANMKSEINSNIDTAISGLKTELKLDDANMKSEINSNINTAISGLKTEFDTNMNDFDNELQNCLKFENLKSLEEEIKKLK